MLGNFSYIIYIKNLTALLKKNRDIKENYKIRWMGVNVTGLQSNGISSKKRRVIQHEFVSDEISVSSEIY